jgi:hypothetical protein
MTNAPNSIAAFHLFFCLPGGKGIIHPKKFPFVQVGKQIHIFWHLTGKILHIINRFPFLPGKGLLQNCDLRSSVTAWLIKL